MPWVNLLGDAESRDIRDMIRQFGKLPIILAAMVMEDSKHIYGPVIDDRHSATVKRDWEVFLQPEQLARIRYIIQQSLRIDLTEGGALVRFSTIEPWEGGMKRIKPSNRDAVLDNQVKKLQELSHRGDSNESDYHDKPVGKD